MVVKLYVLVTIGMTWMCLNVYNPDYQFTLSVNTYGAGDVMEPVKRYPALCGSFIY